MRLADKVAVITGGVPVPIVKLEEVVLLQELVTVTV